MRRCLFVPVLSAVLASTALAVGCSSNGETADASVDSYGVIVGGGDGGAGDVLPGDGGMNEQTTIRLAHASPDLGPVDFCWRTSGSAAFTGPVLGGGGSTPEAGAPADAPYDHAPDSDAGATAVDAAPEAGDADATLSDSGAPEAAAVDAAAGDAGSLDAGAADGASVDAGPADAATTGALVFGTMTPDVRLPSAGTFDIALVAAGETSCATRRMAGTVTLDPGKRTTIVLMGRAAEDGGPNALRAVGFTDGPLDPQTARVRIIHAALGSASEAPAPPLAVRAGAVVLSTEVDPRSTSAVSTTPAVDPLGYTTVPPLTPPTSLVLSTVGDAAAASWTTAGRDLAVRAGTAHTGIVVSLDQGSLGVAWCSSDPTTAGVAATCLLLPASP